MYGYQLEDIHHQIQAIYQQNPPDIAAQSVKKHLVVLNNFFKYLLLQTFPEVLSIQNVDEYQQILD